MLAWCDGWENASLRAKKPRFNDTSGAGLAELPQDDAVPGSVSLC